MNHWKKILEKFISWKYDIYENNRSTWTDKDDDDVRDIELLIEQKTINKNNNK